jgi:hypothetical protein
LKRNGYASIWDYDKAMHDEKIADYRELLKKSARNQLLLSASINIEKELNLQKWNSLLHAIKSKASVQSNGENGFGTFTAEDIESLRDLPEVKAFIRPGTKYLVREINAELKNITFKLESKRCRGPDNKLVQLFTLVQLVA